MKEYIFLLKKLSTVTYSFLVSSVNRGSLLLVHIYEVLCDLTLILPAFVFERRATSPFVDLGGGGR